jgi:hypothetical protein
MLCEFTTNKVKTAFEEAYKKCGRIVNKTAKIV